MNYRRNTVPLAGAVAVITGGAGGIGWATARRLLAGGARVSLWDRNADALADALTRLVDEGFSVEQIHTVVVDITDYAALHAAVERLRAHWEAPEILVNNAGHLAPGSFVDQDGETWMQTLAVNVNALVYLTRIVMPEMYHRGRGHVVNVSSAAGAIGVPFLAVYSASKGAVWGFSEALRGEARTHGVLVSSIHPSFIATGMFAGARLSGLGGVIVPRISSHDVIAEAIVERALRRGEERVMRPRSVRLAVFFRGVLPDRWFNALMRVLGVWDSMRSWHG
ncbi:MAG: SDR family oxidoreductase [Spirochaeta sp.]|jgi:NAD(P)-dependent dehydrogenase (short-subunit alcohol dehydrogenase family)|nr:SDR family oxidoreductase [Spirochaeta sp.]